MKSKFTNWFSNPAYFRYSLVVITVIILIIYYLDIGLVELYVFSTLGIMCLGIGFYDRPFSYLAAFTTLFVLWIMFAVLNYPNIFKFLILELTYICILYISVNFMRRYEKIKADHLELLRALSNALDSRDSYTAGHSLNVAKYAVDIAKRMKLPQDTLESIAKGGLLHDIGKIGISETVLLKPGKLTNEEYEIIKSHPETGYNMIKHIDDFKESGILDMVLYHHERYDGTGYPKGLKGEEIPVTARIVAIADAFDAMTSKRVYKSEISIDNTLIELKKNKGTQFDPEITDVFISLLETNYLPYFK